MRIIRPDTLFLRPGRNPRDGYLCGGRHPLFQDFFQPFHALFIVLSAAMEQGLHRVFGLEMRDHATINVHPVCLRRDIASCLILQNP